MKMWFLLFLFSKNFTSIKNIKRKYNPMVKLLKFTCNKKILSGVATLGYN